MPCLFVASFPHSSLHICVPTHMHIMLCHSTQHTACMHPCLTCTYTALLHAQHTTWPTHSPPSSHILANALRTTPVCTHTHVLLGHFVQLLAHMCANPHAHVLLCHSKQPTARMHACFTCTHTAMLHAQHTTWLTHNPPSSHILANSLRTTLVCTHTHICLYVSELGTMMQQT